MISYKNTVNDFLIPIHNYILIILTLLSQKEIFYDDNYDIIS